MIFFFFYVYRFKFVRQIMDFRCFSSEGNTLYFFLMHQMKSGVRLRWIMRSLTLFFCDIVTLKGRMFYSAQKFDVLFTLDRVKVVKWEIRKHKQLQALTWLCIWHNMALSTYKLSLGRSRNVSVKDKNGVLENATLSVSQKVKFDFLDTFNDHPSRNHPKDC